MKRIIVYGAFALFLMSGCGNQATSIKQETSTPTGSIQGLVTDYSTNAGLPGVTISTTSGGGMATAKSNASGIYQLGGLPTGANYPVYFSLQGYGTSIYGTNLGNTPPTFPQGNALAIINAYMFKADGTAQGTVYLNGNPFTQQTANVMIDMRDLTGNTTGFIGIDGVYRTATNPTDGTYTLTNLPSTFNCALSAPIIAWYVDPSGVYYAGQRTVSLCSGGTSFVPNINLTCNLPAPNVVATSQDMSADNSGGGSPLTLHVGVFYNQPMNQTINPTMTSNCGGSAASGFMWTGTTAGQFTVTVNAGINCSGGNYGVRFARNICGTQQVAYTSGVFK